MRVGYGLQTLSLTPGQSKAIVADAKRRFRLHNAGRRHVEASVFATIADSARVPVEAHEVRERLRHAPEVVEARERKIGRAHVGNPVTNAHLVGSRLREKKKKKAKIKNEIQ